MNERSPRPTKASIVPRLLDAVEVACTRVSPSDVTMRMIAVEAGLSVGVAYRYFESREALFGAAMERIGERIAEAYSPHEDPATSLAALWQVLADNPAFPRLVTWLTLSERTPSDVMARHPLAIDVIDKAGRKGLADPEGVAVMTLFMTLSASVFGPAVNRAVGRPGADERFREPLLEMWRIWLERQTDRSDER
jgi:AcrR family transcriptional regulator